MPNTYETIQVGDNFSMKQTITSDDVQQFADLTGDDNPIHIDEAAGRESIFGTTVVHGALLVGYVSKLLGRDFPGPGSIAVSLSAKFIRPVPVGSEVTFEVKVAEKIEARKHIRAKVYAYVNGKMAMGGEALLVPPSA